MREFFVEYKLVILAVAAFFFVVIFIDVIFRTARHKNKKKEESRERDKKNYGNGTVIYAGSEGGLLSFQIDDTVMLIGKPDIVMRDDKTKEIFVVDLKSGKAPPAMEKYHALQLAAYFLMIESRFGPLAVKRGIIRYLDDGGREHSVENSEELKAELLERVRAIAEAKKQLEKGGVPVLVRNHTARHRCKACEFRSDCTQALV